MKRIILCGSGTLDNLTGNPILKREGFEVLHCPDIARTFLEIKRAGADLLLWEQTGDLDESVLFLARLGQTVDPGRTKAICVWREGIPPDLPDFISQNLTAPLDHANLERVIAWNLGMNARSAKRYLLRISLHVQDKSFSCLCNSVDISRTGVFLESPKTLKVDGLYDMAVMGQPGRGVPILQVRILSERAPKPGHPWKFYGAVFEDVPREDIDKMAKALGLED